MVADLKKRFKEIFKFSFVNSIKDKVLLKYVLFLFIFTMAVSISISYFTYYTLEPLIKNQGLSMANTLGTFIYFGAFIFTMIIIASLIESIVSYFIFLRGAVIVAKKQKEFSWHGWFKFLILVIIQQLAALLSIYNLKYLLIPVSAIILACAGIFLLALSSTNYVFVLLGLLFFLISMLLVLAYIIVMVYNSTRLVLAVPVFIQKKIGIMDSLKESWELAKGNVLIIFAMLLFLGLVLSAVNWVISLPLGFFLGAGSQFAPQNASQAIAIMINPLVLLISIPQVLIQSYFLSVQAIMLLAIHSELSEKKLRK